MSQVSNTKNIFRREMWTERMLRNYGGGMYMPHDTVTMPKWIVGSSITFFFISMIVCWIFFGRVPNWDLVFVASLSVVIFFSLGNSMSRRLSNVSEKHFLKNIFYVGFTVRMIWVLYLYFIFNPNYYGTTFGDGADVDWYIPFGQALADLITNDTYLTLSQIIDNYMSAIDDVGYPIILAIEYAITGKESDVFVPLLVKSIMGACCAIMIYHVAKRHFGVGTARITALFICLNPNMIYWCGSMMKEAEMVFFCCLAVDKLDHGLSSGNKLTLRALWPGLLAGLILFFMRTALGLALFIGVLAHIVLASNQIISVAKKIIAGVLVATTLFVGVGDRLIEQSKGYLDVVRSDSQQVNMEWRSNREGGNSFAKYASATIFAPLIFTIPFPTLNMANEGQLTQMQLAGGSYIKNILSFFVIMVLLLLLLSGEWRKHVFILAYMCGYLVVLVFSGFAQSGRFHMPIWPMLMLFAAYGIQIAKGNVHLRHGFNIVLMAEVLVCLVWNWFKLKGRGMI
ncbi:MAG: glycosyltransferase family 39 protein [Paludibacteraceae bacterium]|nr:glycosyltransferase family 39 protein [Paludibacteraceae bacterium]